MVTLPPRGSWCVAACRVGARESPATTIRLRRGDGNDVAGASFRWCRARSSAPGAAAWSSTCSATTTLPGGSAYHVAGIVQILFGGPSGTRSGVRPVSAAGLVGHRQPFPQAARPQPVERPGAGRAAAALPARSARRTHPHRHQRLGKFNKIGHRITGDRTGQSENRGVDWEFVHVCIYDASHRLQPNDEDRAQGPCRPSANSA